MIEWNELESTLNSDPEFRYAIRHWTASVRVGVGESHHLLRLDNGELAELVACEASTPCDIHISGARSEWRELLRAVPRPFYQDLVFASVHHGFELNPEALDYAAYYPALRRLVEVMRESTAGRPDQEVS